MNEVIRQLCARKSVRAYTDRDITAEEKHAILTCAAQAPTAGNQQLYTIIDVTDPALREKLAESCDHQPMIAKAKMVLVFCADCKKWYDAYRSVGCEPRDPGVGDLMLAVGDAMIAAQNAVTAAESLGIGSCYVGDIMENFETQRALLGLPEYVFPAGMVIFGFPTEQQQRRESAFRQDSVDPGSGAFCPAPHAKAAGDRQQHRKQVLLEEVADGERDACGGAKPRRRDLHDQRQREQRDYRAERSERHRQRDIALSKLGEDIAG